MANKLELTPILLTQEDVARMLQVTTRTVRTWANEGKIPKPLVIGTRPRWDAAVITEWLNAQGAKP